MDAAPVNLSETHIAGGKRLGRITLANPKALNAVRLDMIQAIQARLGAWDADPDLVCIVIDAEGDKAFCAGGDIVSLYRSVTGEGDPDYPLRFFTEEYRLCHDLRRLATPCLAWGHGVVMGGGLGMFAAASHRVVTETANLAMPEIKIGLFPDVAATWFFNRMPYRLALFIALTGASMNSADALFVGLAEHAIEHAQKDAVLDALSQAADWQHPHATVSRVLIDAGRTHAAALAGKSRVLAHLDSIFAATTAPDLAVVVAQITALADGHDEWLATAANNLIAGCPVTAHLIYRQLIDGRNLSLRQIAMRELKMAMQCCLHPDFAEGVRALLIDKDKTPRWHFDSVAEVPDDYVDEHFAAPWNGANPLADLPVIEA